MVIIIKLSSYYVFARCVKWVMMYIIIIIRCEGSSVGMGRLYYSGCAAPLTSSVNYRLPPPINWNCLHRLVAGIITIIIPSSYYCAPVFICIFIHLYASTHTHKQMRVREPFIRWTRLNCSQIALRAESCAQFRAPRRLSAACPLCARCILYLIYIYIYVILLYMYKGV